MAGLAITVEMLCRTTFVVLLCILRSSSNVVAEKLLFANFSERLVRPARLHARASSVFFSSTDEGSWMNYGE